MDPLKEIITLEENANKIIAPSCIFKPSDSLVRIIIRAVLNFGTVATDGDYTPFFLRFGILADDFWRAN